MAVVVVVSELAVVVDKAVVFVDETVVVSWAAL